MARPRCIMSSMASLFVVVLTPELVFPSRTGIRLPVTTVPRSCESALCEFTHAQPVTSVNAIVATIKLHRFIFIISFAAGLARFECIRRLPYVARN